MGSSQARDQTCVPCIGRQTLNHCATREALGLGFLRFSKKLPHGWDRVWDGSGEKAIPLGQKCEQIVLHVHFAFWEHPEHEM